MVAIRPPEYFPRCAVVGLLATADRFVLADTLRYSRQSFQNRSRLRNPNGWQWISIPLRARQHGRPIQDVDVTLGTRWREKHWRAFMYNYRSTLYFEYFEDDFQPFFDHEWPHLSDWTCRSVEQTAALFDLDTEIVRASSLPGAPDTLEAIHAAVGGGPVLSPADAASHDADALPADADVHVFRFAHPEYRQNFEGFEAGMAALDLLFNHGPQGLRTVLQASHTAAYAP